jgi:hypothetical protein
VAEEQGHVCVHDQLLLALLLAADVAYVEPDSTGQEGTCAYQVRERTPAATGAAVEALPAGG